MSIIYLRAAVGGAIALIVTTWFYHAAGPLQQQLMLLVAMLFLFMLVIQALYSYSRVSLRNQYLIGYISDALLAGLLIFTTGGVTSPFAFLSGLIVIASGLHGMRMLPQLVSVAACIAYLTATYADEWIVYRAPIDFQQALHALLQVSALLLVGGVMAYISSRQTSLRATSDRAVRQHRQLKDLYDRVMQSMQEGMVVLDENLRLSDMNRAAGKLLGPLRLDELLTTPELQAYFAHPERLSFQFDYIDDEKVLLVRVTRLAAGADATWLLTLVDISDVRKLEQELIQQEKMAALGQMAAMLAHEIRNPIQTMTQGLEFIGAGGGRDINIKHILHDEMLRLNRLASMMLDYAKPLLPTPDDVNVSELIASAVAQVEITGGRVLWECDVDHLTLDPDHFRLVLDNLLSNALANREGEGEVRIALHADKGGWRLKVCNPGTIAEEMQERIFEPFVSGRSRGVGLGLATVQQVCRSNDWQVELESGANITCFTVSGAVEEEQALAEMMHLEEQDG